MQSNLAVAHAAADPVLAIERLTVSFATDSGLVSAVDGVSLRVGPREKVGLVGESGSGKSVTSLAVMRLLACPPATISARTIALEGTELQAISEREMQAIRGNRVSMVFQDPMSALNPVFTVGHQIAEAYWAHKKCNYREAWDRAVAMLRRVGIPSPDSRAHSYPHQLSGGMRQRVMIAMALICEPALLIADEPTTALDVTVQAQVLELIDELSRDMGMSVLLITHDLGVVAEVAEHLVVLYAGQVVEEGPVDKLLSQPKHPYTRGLVRSIPKFPPEHGEERARLQAIEGIVPDMRRLPVGCRFADRCSMVVDECRKKPPELVAIDPESARRSRCFRAAEVQL
jgi:oligopeptide/dipeptide ABC transporter ATP-binding protein